MEEWMDLEDIEVEGEEALESLGVKSFLTARVQEITSLSMQIAASGGPSSKGLAFQHVPKHMRRRAVSHNVKRLPTRLRQIHANQVEKSSGGVLSKKTKVPSRKYRRRKSNLLEEYNRRQREFKWLETHIWHAKRFHMENKWGYKMPMKPTDKGFRAIYRGASKHCVMRDVSFTSCLQIEGPYSTVATLFTAAFMPKQCNPLGLGSEMFRMGMREGSMYFYKRNSYPFGYVGKVRFQWVDNQKAVWLWVHPVHKEAILDEISSEFELEEEIEFQIQIKSEEKEEIGSDRKGTGRKRGSKGKSVDEVKLEPKRLLRRKKWRNEKTGVVLTDLDGVFNRIRFYGPLATEVIKETLQVLPTDKIQTEEASKNDSPWWMDHFAGEGLQVLDKQLQLWNSLTNFHVVPCNSIVPLVVRDPRVSLPKKRTKELPFREKTDVDELGVSECVHMEEEEMAECGDENIDCDFEFSRLLTEFWASCQDFPLFSSHLRNLVSKQKMSCSEFSNERAQLLIPGSKLELGVRENQIPVMLVNRPSFNVKRFQTNGWDLILPAGWAMEFWVAFSYRAVRVCGLLDATHLEFESGSIHVANEDSFQLPPDTASGMKEIELNGVKLREDYFKMTPAKRVNVIKLGCPFPFQICWNTMLNFQNSTSSSKYHVLRDLSVLKVLANIIRTKLCAPEVIDNLISSAQFESECIVGVRLVTVDKGVIEQGAVICLPCKEDIDMILSKKLAFKDRDEPLFQEPAQEDYNHQERVDSRERHTKFMSFLQRKRSKLRKKGKDPSADSCESISIYDSSKVSASFNENMESLWLPESNSALSKMSRYPLGFIVHGHESYSTGRCSGLGYCSLKGLHRWLMETKTSWNSKSLVLVRNCRDSLVYRLARLEVSQLC